MEEKIDIELTKKEADYLNSLLHTELLFKENKTGYDDYKPTLFKIKSKIIDAME